jgi:uncharacterized membrane protein YidH (DUF202 family)
MTEQIQGPQGDPREYMANERTFLAWIRTGVSLVSFGLAVTQFEVVLGFGGFGIGLVALGCLTLVTAMIHFLRTRRQLDKGEFAPSVAGYVIIAAGTLGLAGAFMVYVLLA